MLEHLNLIESHDPFKLKPENDKKGNIEYKLRLDTKPEKCLSKLATQFKWRIYQSTLLYKTSEAYYVIGILDNGNLPPKDHNITSSIISLSVKILKDVMESANNEIINEEYYNDNLLCILKIRPKFTTNTLYIKDIKDIKDKKDKREINEINIVLTGPSGSGKTSLMSLIVNNEIDDGDGLSRQLMLKHDHERDTGNTSCINRKFIGFTDNNLINEESCIEEGMEYIYSESDRYITIDDLPGCEKFIRTTIYGLLSPKNDITVICIPLDNIEKTLKFYKNIYKICCLKKNKVVFLLTKIDLIPEDLIEKFISIKCENIMKIFDIKKINNILEQQLDQLYQLDKLDQPYLIPITNLDKKGCLNFTNYLSKMSENIITNTLCTSLIKTLFITNEIFISPSSGNIFYGYVKGTESINLGDNLYVISNGILSKSTIISIKKKNIESKNIIPGETGSISVKPNMIKNKDAIFFSLNKNTDINNLIVNKALFTTDKKIQEKEYLLFNGPQIQDISINFYKEYKNENIYIITCKKNKNIFLGNDNICVLKDENYDIIVGIISPH